MTGVRGEERIAGGGMGRAEKVVMGDLTPRALLNRLARGVVYAPEKAQKAIENFFQESTLVALRELALRQTAHEVEIRQVDYESPGFQPTLTIGNESEASAPRDTSDRILIHVTGDPATAMLIRRGKRVADYLHADCFAVAVSGDTDSRDTSEREALERHLNFARNLHIEARILQGA